MTDIHTHILPGIDDGAKDEKVSEEMLSALYTQGVRRVVFTPHYYGQHRSPQDFLKLRSEAYEKIKGVVPAGMQTALGAEVHFSETVAMNTDCVALSVGDTRYILIEFPFLYDWPATLLQKLRYFMDETEKIPVIAHFCRYSQVRKNPGILSDLADMGCLLQANTSAFLDKRDKGLVFAAMRHGLVHCLGTDCHNTAERAPNYMQAAEAIKKAGYGEALEKIEETMENILADRYIPREKHTPVKKFLTIYK